MSRLTGLIHAWNDVLKQKKKVMSLIINTDEAYENGLLYVESSVNAEDWTDKEIYMSAESEGVSIDGVQITTTVTDSSGTSMGTTVDGKFDWTQIIYSKGEYDVKYECTHGILYATKTVRLIVVDTRGLIKIDDNNKLIIDCPDFTRESILKFKNDQSLSVLPTFVSMNGNPHKTPKMVYIQDNGHEEPLAAFYGFNIESIVIGSGVTYLDKGAFFRCQNIVSIDLSQTQITRIESYTFSQCRDLETIVLPETVVTIEDEAFYYNRQLKDVNMSNVTAVGHKMFYNCGQLKSINLRSIQTIGTNFLWGCNLTHIVVHDHTSPLFSYSRLSEDFMTQNDIVPTITLIDHQTTASLAKFRSKYTGINFLNDLTSSFSGGDPYVYPMVGPCYKLPNCEDVYRLYQDEDVVINAKVSVASPEIQAEIVAAAAKGFDFLRPVSAEAYFYSQILVASRTSDDQVLVDLEQKQHAVTGSSTENMFRVEPPEVSKDSRPYEDEGSSYVGIPVRWGRDACLSISFSRNPQIRNGVRLSGTGLADGTGLLMRNYRAKFFRLPNISSTAAVSLPNGCTRPLTKRGVVGHKEIVIKC